MLVRGGSCTAVTNLDSRLKADIPCRGPKSVGLFFLDSPSRNNPAIQGGSKYPNIEDSAPKYSSYDGFGTLCHDIWILAPFGQYCHEHLEVCCASRDFQLCSTSCWDSNIYSRSQKVGTWPSSNPKPKREAKPAYIILHPCSNVLESTV